MSPNVFDASKNPPPKVTGKPNPSRQIPSQARRAPITKRNPREYSSVLANAEPCKSAWSSYAPLPAELSFDSQMTDEQILMFLRQHPIVNLPWIFIAILMTLAPFLVLPIFAQYLHLQANLVLVFWMGWYLITAGFIVERVLLYLFNSFIITDERMVDIDFSSVIFKQVDYAQLDRIQDVSSRTGGVLFSLLDVGSVFVQTAGEVPEFVFDNVAHPSRIAKLLDELVEEEQKEYLAGGVSMRNSPISEV
jgi:hypothetical protein